MIEVRNVGEYEFPFKAASNYAQGAMVDVPKSIPASNPGERIDGGALRSFPLSAETEELEVVLNTDGKQLNARIELLNAPNNPKQTFEVFTNNGELNSLCVCFKCPDAGNTVRVVNLATVEFRATPTSRRSKRPRCAGAENGRAMRASWARACDRGVRDADGNGPREPGHVTCCFNGGATGGRRGVGGFSVCRVELRAE